MVAIHAQLQDQNDWKTEKAKTEEREESKKMMDWWNEIKNSL